MPEYDIIITGGRVIDPANGIDGPCSVAIGDGRIAAVAPEIGSDSAGEIYDATGKIVCPGLVDLHIHGYHPRVPISIDADRYCLGRCVTTAVDAGSAGCDTFDEFRSAVVAQRRTRLLAFLHISRIGLSHAGLGGDSDTPGELDNIDDVDTRACIDTIEANRDLIIGVKIRLSDTCADNGRNEAESYRRAREAAASTDLPLMVHHSFSTVPLEDCPGKMSSGDVYTHCFHGFPSTIIDPDTRSILPVVHDARQRGVLFDIGFGQGSFSWAVAEICALEGFWPDTISTDIHSGTCEGPAYDLPTVMTRLLHLGMPLQEVIRRATTAPARALRLDPAIGTLTPGAPADVAVLDLVEGDQDLEDCQGVIRRIARRLVPAAVWRGGEAGTITAPEVFPNTEMIARQHEAWYSRLMIKDDST